MCVCDWEAVRRLTCVRVQEHHGQPLRHLVFNAMDADKGNLFATVAHNQVRALRLSSSRRRPNKSRLCEPGDNL